MLPETKGKSLAEVSDYFYVCCAFNKKPITEDETKWNIDDKPEDVTISKSFIYSHDDKVVDKVTDVEKDFTAEEMEEKIERRSVEMQDMKILLKRRTLEDSKLGDGLRERVEEMKELEDQFRRKSVPIVRIEELDQLLSDD